MNASDKLPRNGHIQTIYDYLLGLIKKVDASIGSVRSRMNALTTLANSGGVPAGTIEAEVVDARVDSTGQVYANLGEAVRSMQSGYRQIDFGWKYGTVDANGDEAPATGRKRSAFLPADLLRGMTLNIDADEPLSSTDRVACWTYAADKTAQGIYKRITASVTLNDIPADAAYLRFISPVQTVDKVSAVVLARQYDVELNKAIDDVRQGVEDAEERLEEVEGRLEDVGFVDFGWGSGKLNLDSDGSEAVDDNFLRSSYIPTKGLPKWKLVINGTLTVLTRINTVWYAEDKTYIARGNSYTETTDNITVPYGAKFIRFVIKKEVVNLVKLVPNIEERLEDVEGHLNKLETMDFGWESGKINLGVNGDGSEAEDNKYIRSLYVPTKRLSKLKLVINGTLTERINTALYAEDKTYCGRGASYTETTDDITVSNNNAKFIRFVIQAKDVGLVKLQSKTEERLEDVEGRLEDVEERLNSLEDVEERLNSLEGVESVISDVSVASLNRDKEHLLYSAWQSCAPRLRGGSVDDPPGTALGFIHFSDVHGTLISWKRLGAYLDHFSDLFSFALHTGDYVPSNQGNYSPTAGNMYQRVATEKPILNCVGNHDTLLSDGVTKNPDSSAARNILFADIENWGVNQPSDEVMYYYKDFGDVRLIVLDQYYTDATETAWLTGLLDDARTNGKSVITASHTQTAPIIRNISTFNDIDRPSSALLEANGFESVIKAFKDAGGTHICHLGGHWHWDVVGFTDNGILNILVECATIYGGGYRNDVRRYGDKAEGQSRAYDCFNAVFVDTFTHTIRIIRIGSNTDNYLHPKNTLCIDYAAGTLISNA